MNITGHTVEKLEDPFGLLTGDRYEFLLNIEVDEEDELYTEKGLGLRVIYVDEEGKDKISQYHFFEGETGKYFEFSLDDEEEELVIAYCRMHKQN
jgi:hypothetical protein